MEKLSTEDLLRVIESPLTEWRRLPVKHPQQIASRNQVVNAFEELGRRLITANLHIEKLEALLTSKQDTLDRMQSSLQDKEQFHVNLRERLIAAQTQAEDIKTQLDSRNLLLHTMDLQTTAIDDILNGKVTGASLGSLIDTIRLRQKSLKEFTVYKETKAQGRRARARSLVKQFPFHRQYQKMLATVK